MPDKEVHLAVCSWLMGWTRTSSVVAYVILSRAGTGVLVNMVLMWRNSSYTFLPIYFHFVLIKHFQGKKYVTLLFG
jgi:hypothetical protein